jgi:Fe-S cluster assembly protein SufD
MIEAALSRGFSQAAFDAFIASRAEPGWLVAQRRQAWQDFRSMSWPSRRDEQWMRTDIRLFKLDHYAIPEPATSAPQGLSVPPALLAEGVTLGGISVAQDGVPVLSRLAQRWRARGVIFGSLDQLVGAHSELIKRHLLTRAVDPRYDRFAALHAAIWSGGHFLYVPRGVAVDEPLCALSAMTDGAADSSHALVILEEGAEATLLTETASTAPPAGGLHCGANELFVGPGARLRFVSLQNWGTGVWHFAHQTAHVGRDAALQWTIGALGSRLAKVNQHVILVGEGAETQVNGVMFTEGTQHLSYHTLQHHTRPCCRSDFLYKAALQDKSRTVWRGMIKVDPLAQKTDGYQRNDNLLLSARARADSIPGLEIEAHDVRCTHGSTTGRVDEELIFYACARGYSRQEAIRMIVNGFFQQVFDRITIESVRDALSSAIARRVREYE